MLGVRAVVERAGLLGLTEGGEAGERRGQTCGVRTDLSLSLSLPLDLAENSSASFTNRKSHLRRPTHRLGGRASERPKQPAGTAGRRVGPSPERKLKSAPQPPPLSRPRPRPSTAYGTVFKDGDIMPFHVHAVAEVFVFPA